MRKFTSPYDIGEVVTMYLATAEILVEIQAVIFTDDKVWYDVTLEYRDGIRTSFHMVDSAILER